MSEPTPTLDQKTIRSSPLLWLLGVLCALLLGALGTRGLSDIADAFHEPTLDEFAQPRTEPIREQLEVLERQPDPRQNPIAAARRDLDALDRSNDLAEQSWRTWLETRATLGGTAREDQDLRTRRNRLDELRAQRDQAQARLAEMLAAPDPRDATRVQLNAQLAEAEHLSSQEFQRAQDRWRWKVLAARLALVFPVSLLAMVLWRRRARIAYPTLLWGYWAFALWMLLWGMGPYLPRYGGYAPLVMGLGLTLWASISLGRWLNGRAALRRRRIVDQAIRKHRCPGCDRDYLLGRETSLDAGLGRKARTLHYDSAALHPRSCAICGLALFAACSSCHAPALVHAERCASCGTAMTLGNLVPVGSPA